MSAAHKLTPLECRNLKTPGLYPDGAGLLLKVTKGLSKSWIHRYMIAGRDRWMGLGPYPDVGLAEARELAAENRRKLRRGIDPLDERAEQTAATRAARAKAVTFDWCAGQYIAAHRAGWKSAKSAEQWESSLQTYAAPTIGALDVGKIETPHILKILQDGDFWTTKTETASRVRGRIESILDWAAAHKYRTGENPARWKGHLDALLPARSKVAKVEHHAALPYAEIGPFMTALRKQAGIAARACEFAILTAARSGEVRGATWSEIDEAAGVWVIPAERMKGGKEHRVPLSAESRALIASMKKIATDATLIFPGMKEGKALSDMSLTAVLRRMDRGDLTMHGFRSTFRDWAAETTDYPHEMQEMALAHTVGDKVEAAYRRGDMLEKRRAMMQDWANYCKEKTDAPDASE